MTKRLRLLAVFFLLLSAPAAAQPVEISADKSLEWNRREKTYTARQNAVATQGDMTLSADNLSAAYDDAGGGMDIRRITAEGNVRIHVPPYTAAGDRGVYDLATETAILTGGDLSITTATEKLAAQEKIEFFRQGNRLVASGGASATRGTDRLQAQTLTAVFEAGADGKLALNRIEGEGGVTITTIRETVTGNRGIYDAAGGTATLTGKVRLRQGDNWVEGTRAVVNMQTGQSQLFAEGQNNDGRVRGVFYPKKDEETPAGNATPYEPLEGASTLPSGLMPGMTGTTP